MAAAPRLALPSLDAGQAQREFTHDEALSTLDAIVEAAAEGGSLDAPPASPTLGACYVVGSAPTDAWTGNPNALEAFTSGGWKIVAPLDGASVYIKATALGAHFSRRNLGNGNAARLECHHWR